MKNFSWVDWFILFYIFYPVAMIPTILGLAYLDRGMHSSYGVAVKDWALPGIISIPASLIIWVVVFLQFLLINLFEAIGL